MSSASKAFFVPAPPVDAYREWKSFLGLPNEDDGTKQECSGIEDIPYRGVHWSSRWGVAQIDGRADFIPVQGGCMLYLNLAGVGVLSRLVLSTVTPLERGVSNYMSRFRRFSEEPRKTGEVH